MSCRLVFHSARSNNSTRQRPGQIARRQPLGPIRAIPFIPRRPFFSFNLSRQNPLRQQDCLLPSIHSPDPFSSAHAQPHRNNGANARTGQLWHRDPESLWRVERGRPEGFEPARCHSGPDEQDRGPHGHPQRASEAVRRASAIPGAFEVLTVAPATSLPSADSSSSSRSSRTPSE